MKPGNQSESNHAYLLSLGAEKAVDYHNPDWTEQVLQWMPGGVDAVVAVQPGTSSDSLPVVKDAGSLITISGDALVSERGVHMGGIPYQVEIRDELVQLMTDIAEGGLRVELERVYPFEEALAALAKCRLVALAASSSCDWISTSQRNHQFSALSGLWRPQAESLPRPCAAIVSGGGTVSRRVGVCR